MSQSNISNAVFGNMSPNQYYSQNGVCIDPDGFFQRLSFQSLYAQLKEQKEPQSPARNFNTNRNTEEFAYKYQNQQNIYSTPPGHQKTNGRMHANNINSQQQQHSQQQYHGWGINQYHLNEFNNYGNFDNNQGFNGNNSFNSSPFTTDSMSGSSEQDKSNFDRQSDPASIKDIKNERFDKIPQNQGQQFRNSNQQLSDSPYDEQSQQMYNIFSHWDEQTHPRVEEFPLYVAQQQQIQTQQPQQPKVLYLQEHLDRFFNSPAQGNFLNDLVDVNKFQQNLQKNSY